MPGTASDLGQNGAGKVNEFVLGHWGIELIRNIRREYRRRYSVDAYLVGPSL
jgi:hypothetical protein